MEYELDPYDSIAFAIVGTAGCEIFVTRDKKIINNKKENVWREARRIIRLN